MKALSQQLQEELSKAGSVEKAQWLENYVKHNIKSKGVGIPEVRSLLKQLVKSTSLDQADFSDQQAFLDDLMRQEYTEDKLAAIIYTQLYWKSIDPEQKLSVIAEWFDQHWISDWNVCDWLCVRILTPMVDTDPEVAVWTLSEWNEDKYLWKARASLVPFAQAKTLTQHWDVVNQLSTHLIRREERFAKTAVGWVLREYSKIDSTLVLSFLDEHKDHTTREVIRNATKYL